MKRIKLFLITACMPLILFAQSGVINPEQYGAIGKNKTCEQMGWSQSKIDSKFKDVGAKPYWTVDRAAWQRCLMQQAETGKIIIPSLPQYYLDSMLFIDGLEPYVMGNKNKVIATGNGSWYMVGRRNNPTTHLEMEAMFSGTNMTIMGLHFIGNGNTGGIHANCVRFARIISNEFNSMGGGKWAIAADFAMYGDIRQNIVSGVRNGIRAGLAMPASNESSSNLIRVIQNECHTCSDTAFANLFGYKPVFDQNIIEGNGNTLVGFYGDMSNKTTAKNMDLGIWHLEQTGTAQVAWFKIKLRDQYVKLFIPEVQDATNGLLVDIESTNDGMIILEGLKWFNEQIYFKTKGTTWKFHYCDAIDNSNKNTIWFEGSGYTRPSEGKASSEGTHSYELILIK